jgi:peptide/nickel transport system substrate-binding protein
MYIPRRGRPAVTAVTLSALALAGCSSKPQSAAAGGASGSAGKPVSGGSLTYGVETEPATLNPQLSGQDKARVTLRNAYDNLFSVTDSGEVEAWLASGYTVSADQKSYTVTLRQGVAFWDGEAFDAAAVVKNIDEVLNPKYDSFGAVGPFSNIKSVTAQGEYTVVFTLKDVYSPFLITLANLPIISPDSYGKADLKSGGPDIVGTGPFVLQSYTRGQDIVFTRNPKYDSADRTAATSSSSRRTRSAPSTRATPSAPSSPRAWTRSVSRSRRRGSGCWRRWTWCGWARTTPTGTRARCPAASGSGSRSRGRWPHGPSW